ncbi:MAG TPA: hypothetical protein VGR84_06235, partial [Candidatus Acidoferrales bacterium]|nr:hypothetical protein [Candidatus Acidoferrales bacterium]
DYRNGDVDIFVSTSQDRGASWFPAVRVNSDPIHNGSDQFFQWLSVDPITGAAYVVFYDRRDDPGNKNTTVVLARSTDGGHNFENFAWTRKAFQSRDDFIGDYTGLAAFNGRVYGIWAEEVRSASSANVRTRNRKSHAPLDEIDHHRTIVRIGVADFGKSN